MVCTATTFPLLRGTERISPLNCLRQISLPSSVDNAISSPPWLPINKLPPSTPIPPLMLSFVLRCHKTLPVNRFIATTRPLWSTLYITSPSITGVRWVKPSPCPAPTSRCQTFLSLTVASKSTSSIGSLPVFLPNTEQPDSRMTHSRSAPFKHRNDQFISLIQRSPRGPLNRELQ